MQMNNKKGNFAELAYVMGMILCPLGVCLSAKSGFGVSMVVAPAYVLYLRISETLPWFTFGKSEYIFQGLLLIVLGIAGNVLCFRNSDHFAGDRIFPEDLPPTGSL